MCIRDSQKSLQMQFSELAIYNWAPTQDSETTPVLKINDGNASKQGTGYVACLLYTSLIRNCLSWQCGISDCSVPDDIIYTLKVLYVICQSLYVLILHIL